MWGKTKRCAQCARHDACDLQMRTYYINSSGLKDVLFQPAIHIRFICKSPSIGLPFVCPILDLLHVVLQTTTTTKNGATKLKNAIECTHQRRTRFTFQSHFVTFIHIALLRFTFPAYSMLVFAHLPFRLIKTTTFSCPTPSLAFSLSAPTPHKPIHSEHNFYNFTWTELSWTKLNSTELEHHVGWNSNQKRITKIKKKVEKRIPSI